MVRLRLPFGMVHHTTVVSRKTPLDGRLELAAGLATLLGRFDGSLEVSYRGVTDSATLEQMACSCAKGDGAGHVHHFLRSELLRSLPPEATAHLSVDLDGGWIGIDAEP